jgi:hypothetical protein
LGDHVRLKKKSAARIHAEEAQGLGQHRQHDAHGCQNCDRRRQDQQRQDDLFHPISGAQLGPYGAKRHNQAANRQNKRQDGPTDGTDLSHVAIILGCLKHLRRHFGTKGDTDRGQTIADTARFGADLVSLVFGKSALQHGHIQPGRHTSYIGKKKRSGRRILDHFGWEEST